MAKVWEIVLDKGERDVLLVMADHANDDGICWPSNALIAWKADYKDVRSVRRIRRSLEAKGLVTVLSGGQGGRSENGGGVSPKCQLHLDRGTKKPPFRGEVEEREDAPDLSSETTSVELGDGIKEDILSPLNGAEPRGTFSREASGIKEDLTARKEDLVARNGDTTARKEDTAMSSEPPRTTTEPPGPPVDARVGSDFGKQTNEIMTLALVAGKQYPKNVKGHLAGQIKKLLEEGFTYHQVLEATKIWERKGLNPATLPSLVNEVVNGDGSGLSRGNHKPFDSSTQNYESAVIR